MMKKYISVLIVVIVLIMFCFIYNYCVKKTDYNFDNVVITKEGISGKGKEFKQEIENIGLSNTIIKWRKTGVQLRLSNHELRKVLNSKETKQYIGSYQTLEELKRQPGIETGDGKLF